VREEAEGEGWRVGRKRQVLTGELSNKSSLAPQRPRCIKEGRDGSREAPVAGGRPEEETVETGEVVGLDDGVVGEGRGFAESR
jgi:hypothetical protein